MGAQPSWRPVSKPALLAGCSLGLAAAGAAILFVFDPETSALYPPCPFHALTGLYCPGCGTTRALHQLLHGRPGEAFGLNPLMVCLLPFLGYYLATFGAKGRSLSGIFASPFWGWLMLGVFLAYWILRNIPLYPFSLLAP